MISDAAGEVAIDVPLDREGSWRCLAFHRLDGAVALQSRQRKSLTAFPDVTAARAATHAQQQR